MPEPPCFLHLAESLRESKKSSVTDFLKEKIDYSSPSNVNTIIVDEMLVVRSSLKEKSSNFESFARHLLIKLLKLSNYRLDLWFDIYESTSMI